MALLQKIADQMDYSVMNVLEFRHRSWWSGEVYDFMEEHGLVFCSVSASELPEDLIQTGSAVYIRFHGKDGLSKHNYPDEELAAWAQKIKRQNPRWVLCYFNNDFNANATRNCLKLKQLLELHSQSTPAPFAALM
jgi:uncharacterized protein YecE (DUF72 family)